MEPTTVGSCGICGKRTELASGLCLRLDGCYSDFFRAYVDCWPERLDVLDYVRDWLLGRNPWVKDQHQVSTGATTESTKSESPKQATGTRCAQSQTQTGTASDGTTSASVSTSTNR